MRKALAIAAAITAGTMLGGGAQAGGPVGETVDYVGVVGDLIGFCNPDPSLNIGAGCFNVNGSSVVVTVADAVNMNVVGFKAGWYEANGMTRIGGFVNGLCGSAELGAPEGAEVLKIFVSGPISGPADCATTAPAGIGILGTITVDWSVPV